MKLGLLLGAGFSYDLGMPLTHELTEVFLGLFNQRNVDSFGTALANSDPYGKGRPINKTAIFSGLNYLLKYKGAGGNNYEQFLSELQELSSKQGTEQCDRDSYNYLFSIFYDIIHTILSLYQKASFTSLYPKNMQCYLALDNILSNEETWVFTLNHDVYVECLAIDYHIPVTYGDTGTTEFPLNNLDLENQIRFTCSKRGALEFSSLGFFRGQKGINIVKLHGGLSELEYKDGTYLCNIPLNKNSSKELMDNFVKIEKMGFYANNKKVPSAKDRVITNDKGELDIICKSMLTGGKKYSRTAKVREGEEKLKIFDDVLSDIEHLTIIGYGFGDHHINFRISNAMVKNQNFAVQIVDPGQNAVPACLKQFDYDSRVKRAFCAAPLWFNYSKDQTWDSEKMKILKDNEIVRMEIKREVAKHLRQWASGMAT